MKNLLVCVDGSGYSVACLEQAIAIAKPFKATVDVLYVTDVRIFEMSAVADFGGALGAQPYTGVMEQIQIAEHSKAEVIKKIASRIFEKRDYLQFMRFHHQRGFLTDIIEEFENSDLGIDMIILGKRGEHFENFKDYLGATMERVLKSSKTPCLVMTEKYHSPKKILLAYDGSAHSSRAVRGFLRMQELFQGEIHLVSVLEENDPKQIRESLKDVEKLFQEAKFKVTTAVLKGEVGDAILKYIKKEEIDMLVMGAYGDSAIRHLIVGSKTVELLTRTNLPVLVYRQED